MVLCCALLHGLRYWCKILIHVKEFSKRKQKDREDIQRKYLKSSSYKELHKISISCAHTHIWKSFFPANFHFIHLSLSCIFVSYVISDLTPPVHRSLPVPSQDKGGGCVKPVIANVKHCHIL